MFFIIAVQAQIYSSSSSPQPLTFIKLPPSETSAEFSADLYRYYQMKLQRDSVRGSRIKQASNESTSIQAYLTNAFNYYKPAFGLIPTASRFTVDRYNDTTYQYLSPTNDMYVFFTDCEKSIAYSVTNIPKNVYHTRPCVRLNDNNFFMTYSQSSYRRNSTAAPSHSFPSKSAIAGWDIGVIMGMINPWNVQAILSETIQYGEDRMISGSAWQSDIDLSRVIGSACFARMMSASKFRNQVRQHRDFMADSLNSSVLALPSCQDLIDDEEAIDSLVRFLPAAPAPSDPIWVSDLAHYNAQLHLLDSIDGDQTLMESIPTSEGAMHALQEQFNLLLSSDETPHLYRLLALVNSCCEKFCLSVQNRDTTSKRKRPFELFNTDPYSYENIMMLQQTTSYPSVHAASGWGTSVVMAMLATHMQDDLLRWGYNYGEHRVLASTNWHSDVTAGRTLGSLALAYLAAGSDFLDLVENARVEYEIIADYVVTDTPTIETDCSEDFSPLYQIDGRRATSQSRGILVGKNKKVLVP